MIDSMKQESCRAYGTAVSGVVIHLNKIYSKRSQILTIHPGERVPCLVALIQFSALIIAWDFLYSFRPARENELCSEAFEKFHLESTEN